jgi:hypothetical protein
MCAAFTHLYEVQDGKIQRMTQYVESHRVSQALPADQSQMTEREDSNLPRRPSRRKPAPMR